MTTLVFCLEEPSAREMLEGVLPRLLPPEIYTRFVVFDGKQDMLRELERKLRCWLTPNTHFVVIRDQDSADCHAIKHELTKLCRCAGKPGTLVRIACHELESFYLGDLAAVERGLGLPRLSAQQSARKFRAPDQLNNAKQELIRLTGGRYQERAGSRAIAPYLRLNTENCSHSFQILLDGIRRIVAGVATAG
ncbi:DUF4276 family protein [Rhodanobacter sp. UC4436_H3]